MVCASVKGYADDEDCGFTINEAGYISTVGPRSFANTGDYVRLLGYAYNTSVPQNVSVTAGTSMDFHSDGAIAVKRNMSTSLGGWIGCCATCIRQQPPILAQRSLSDAVAPSRFIQLRLPLQAGSGTGGLGQ